MSQDRRQKGRKASNPDKLQDKESAGTNGDAVLHQLSLFDKIEKNFPAAAEILLMLKALILKLMDKVEKLEQAVIELFNRMLGGVPFDERTAYTPKEFSEISGLKVETITGHLRDGRIDGFKASGGRGGKGEWRIPKEEVVRYQNEGLKEPAFRYRHPR